MHISPPHTSVRHTEQHALVTPTLLVVSASSHRRRTGILELIAPAWRHQGPSGY